MSIERWHEPPSEREMAALERQARVLAKTGIVQRAFRGKPDDILAVGITARDLGMQLTLTTLSQFHVVEGKVEPSAQMAVALAAARGHEVFFDYAGPDAATVCVRRAGSERLQRLTYTRDEAVQAGLLDSWVERWVGSDGNKRKETFPYLRDGQPVNVDIPEWAQALIGKGDVKVRDAWVKYPTDMLMARASKRAVRKFLPEVLLGLPSSMWTEEPAPAPGPDGPETDTPAPPEDVDVVEGELVDEAVTAEEHPQLVDELWVQRFAQACREVGLNDDQRPALVSHATDGRVRSSKQIRAGDEQRHVTSWFVAVRDGFASVEQTPDGWEVVETAKTRGDDGE